MACSILHCCFFVLSIYWKDSIIGIVTAITGVACVVCTGKGKLSAYLFGLINIVLYAIISLQAKYYGEVMLNMLYYFPMQFYGLYVWGKNMNSETREVKKQNMEWQSFVLVMLGVIAISFAYGLLLRLMGGSLPFVDAFTTIASVFAMIISIKMYTEQWLVWIFVDVVTVIMWAIAYANGTESISVLIMWGVYLANAVIMYVKWNKESKQNGEQ